MSHEQILEVFQGSFPGMETPEQALERMYPSLRREFEFLCILEEKAHYSNEFPVQSVVAKYTTDPTSISMPDNFGHYNNRTNMFKNSEMHAEMLAMDATNRIVLESGYDDPKHIPPGYMLISLVEPCSMCAGTFYRRGGKVLIYGLSQTDLRGKQFKVGDKYKLFDAEPEGYSAEKFLKDRDPQIFVAGGYMRNRIQTIMQHLIRN